MLFDLRASLAVFLVALPLALGVAVASGCPPIAGIMTSLVGGLLVGPVSGSPLQASGAAAGLGVTMLQATQRYDFANVVVTALVVFSVDLMAGVGVALAMVKKLSSPEERLASFAGRR
jgi:MFS superfamily sulfate permease-like transporter